MVVLVGILIVTLASCGNAEPRGTLTTEIYIVQPGDTLWIIAETYIAKNTAGQRDIREFYHGIIELNYDTVFANRPNSLIYPGDELQINYWK
jgi:nucleoid-associated protein YgaU